MNFDRQIRRLGAAALGVTILGGAGAGAAMLSANPAAAAGIVSAVSTITCSVTGSNWCISGNNTSSGIGVIGTSKTGTGLRGTSTSQYGLKATSVTGTAILAQTTSGSTAITATAATGDAVSATATGIGIGLNGISNGGYGVYGGSTSGSGYGVVGNVAGSGVGTYGGSYTGIGVQAISTSGTGISGQSFGSGIGIRAIASTGPALYATNGSGNANPAVYGHNANGNGGDFSGSYIGLVARAPASGGYPLTLTDTSSNNVFYVDGAGDVSYSGGLFHFTKGIAGATVRSFSPSLTTPTLEDTGTAQLSGGAAVVRLDPTFASSMDLASGYRVFVTPNGDTRGLYVATKTPSGFVVRESQGGRSTVTFDYRIVATMSGGAGRRMAATTVRAPVAKAIVERATPNVAPLQLGAPPRPSP